jgi:hypothetical protein
MSNNALQIKTDVINELRNQIYYNQLEINRILTNSAEASHRNNVESIIDLLKVNVLNGSAVDLLEAYLPTKQQPAAIKENEPELSEEVGVKQIQ